LDTEAIYYCNSSFFLKKVDGISTKHTKNSFHHKDEIPYFVIENDDYIITFLNSMSVLASSDYTERLLLVKFEEIMLYLLYKYEEKFEFYCIL
jgi:hypothetical protein